jgi:hypothetical protein
MPQISAAPLPVLNEGEDLEENEDVAINIVDEHSSWTVVKKKKKNKKYTDIVKWTKQQKKNFKRFGDPWYQEPYKYYNAAAHDTPVAVALQPQQQLQQQPVLRWRRTWMTFSEAGTRHPMTGHKSLSPVFRRRSFSIFSLCCLHTKNAKSLSLSPGCSRRSPLSMHAADGQRARQNII